MVKGFANRDPGRGRGGGGGISKRKKTQRVGQMRGTGYQSYSERENCCTYEKERIVNMTDMEKDRGGVEKKREEE